MRSIDRLMVSVVLAVSLSAYAVVGVGCGQKMTYSDGDSPYTREEVSSVFDSVAEPSFLGHPTEDASDLRHSQLASLRSRGEDASALATLLTEQFPGESRSVPYYAETAIVDGTDAWIVLEAWGSEGESLDRLRLWVFDRTTGDVLTSAARNQER
ncbi:MAG: hypothetical protein U1E22_01955 [Coriobacteriia bacterium]|nr:hypothetical protein [Coriobacteriia bacterium]